MRQKHCSAMCASTMKQIHTGYKRNEKKMMKKQKKNIYNKRPKRKSTNITNNKHTQANHTHMAMYAIAMIALL